MKSYRYSPLKRIAKTIYRQFSPVPKSPWTAGHVEDICAVNLVPPQKLVDFLKDCLARLKQIKGDEIGDYLEFGVFNGNSIGSMYRYRISNSHLLKFIKFYIKQRVLLQILNLKKWEFEMR